MQIPQNPSLEHGNNILNIFLTKFVRENNFTGCSSTWFSDIQTYFASDKAVHHALKALSALYAYRESNTDQTRNKTLALESYQTAVLSVRQVVDAEGVKIPQSLVSSTFLLGLFEVLVLTTSSQSQTLTFESSCMTLLVKAGSSIRCLEPPEYSSIWDQRRSAQV